MQLVFYLTIFSIPCMGYLLYLMFRCDRRCDGCDGNFGNFVGTKHTPDGHTLSTPFFIKAWCTSIKFSFSDFAVTNQIFGSTGQVHLARFKHCWVYLIPNAQHGMSSCSGLRASVLLCTLPCHPPVIFVSLHLNLSLVWRLMRDQQSIQRGEVGMLG